MVYADLERRRETQRKRYWEKKGLPVPNGNGGSSQSVSRVPEFVPRSESRPEKIEGFGNNRQDVILDRVKRHWKPIGYTVAGLVLIIGAGLLGYKYQYQIRDQMKGLGPVKREGEPDPFPETTKSNNAMAGLLDFAQDVINRSNTS